MLKVRICVKEKMFNMMLLFVVLILFPIALAEEAPAYDAVVQPCESKCGCEEMYIYDAVNDRCLINFKKVMKSVVTIYEKNNVDVLPTDEMASKLVEQGECGKVAREIQFSFLANCSSVEKHIPLLSERIYIEGEKLFKGIMISVILFMTCASVCVVSACIYCFRINYTDWILKHNVKALAKKLKKDYRSSKMSPKRVPLPTMSESCSVVVEPSGIFVA